MNENSSASWSGLGPSTDGPADQPSGNVSPETGGPSVTPSSTEATSSPASLLSYNVPSPEKPSEMLTPQRRDDTAESLLGFVLAKNIAQTLKAFKWTAEEELRILLELAASDPKGSTRLAALKELDRRRMRALEVEGVLANQSEQALLRLPGQDAEVRRSTAALRIAEKMLLQLRLPGNLSSVPELPAPTVLPDLDDQDGDDED